MKYRIWCRLYLRNGAVHEFTLPSESAIDFATWFVDYARQVDAAAGVTSEWRVVPA